MTAGMLKVASCQFLVSASVAKNAANICVFMQKAKDGGAQIVHFSECALSGYGGANHNTLDGFDWERLRAKTQEIMSLAASLQLWVVLGSMHQLTPPNKPHNCLYLINPKGKIENRYDKRFCTQGDLDYYSPGSRFVTFDINGIRCSLLICFDLRFPEIYRQIKRLKVHCIFQSFYNAGSGSNIHSHIMRQTMQCHAATNYFWISMTNTSGPKSPYSSCFIHPDGKIAAHLKLNRPGMMINTVDISKTFYDPSAPFRMAAIDGALSNGDVINDPRSQTRDIL
jgi:deaminated glutathione amidase